MKNILESKRSETLNGAYVAGARESLIEQIYIYK